MSELTRVSVRDDSRGVVLTLDCCDVEALVIALERYRLWQGDRRPPDGRTWERWRAGHAIELELGEALANAQGVFR